MAKLTDRAIRVLTPREKSYRVFDGGVLYLEVMPSGGRYWRLKYRFAGQEARSNRNIRKQ
ncbi:MAG: Arm DNA-binding domain-containing protein [Steroidobacteraceae bacterium]